MHIHLHAYYGYVIAHMRNPRPLFASQLPKKEAEEAADEQHLASSFQLFWAPLRLNPKPGTLQMNALRCTSKTVLQSMKGIPLYLLP